MYVRFEKSYFPRNLKAYYMLKPLNFREALNLEKEILPSLMFGAEISGHSVVFS